MKRREFIRWIGGSAAAWPLAAHAQQVERIRRIGALQPLAEDDPETSRRVAAFEQGLRQFGWTPGSNIQIDYRWVAGSMERLQAYAAELIKLRPDVLFAAATTSLAALQRQTRTIPIVFAQVTDPVAAGFVASLARPGGNITGFALYEFGLAVKWMELLKQIAPSVVRAGIMYQAAAPQSVGLLREIDERAQSFGLQVTKLPLQDPSDIEPAIGAFARQPFGGLIILPTSLTATYRDVIIRLATEHRLPNIFAFRHFALSGGLASYGVDVLDLHRRAAGYVDRILKGEKPADLPVQQATKFELVINLKTAKALGLDPPMTLLARTDEVIE